ncbi:MAG: hypothetical protein U5J83_04295 [Bryobacterales bacterium]|nr:hypothetical protein [Bryobacterales bacterium]
MERTEIARVLVVKDPKRTRGRWLGVLAGYLVPPTVAVAAGGGSDADPRVSIGMIGGMVLGYYTGKSLDKGNIDIQFLDALPKESASTPSASGLPVYLLAPAQVGIVEAER